MADPNQARLDPRWLQDQIEKQDAVRAQVRDDDILRDYITREARSGLDTTASGENDKDDDVRGQRRNRLSFGPDEQYAERLVEGFRAGSLYSNETRIADEGMASRSRNILFGAFKKDESFALDSYDSETGFVFRRTSKVESNIFRTRDVRYKPDGESHDRITYSYLGGRIERYDYGADGKALLTGSRTRVRSWFIDREPGGLITQTNRRELGGLYSSVRRSWNVTDESGVVSTKSIVTDRAAGPYRTSWTENVKQNKDDDETVENVKTQELGKRGWLYKKTAQYNIETGTKTVSTSMLFGFIRSTPRSVQMSSEETANIANHNELRVKTIEGRTRARIEANDRELATETRLRMVDAATIYRLPQPGSVHRLQDRLRVVQPDFEQARSNMPQERHRAVSAWVNSGGVVPYGRALASEKERARGKAGSELDARPDGSSSLASRSQRQKNFTASDTEIDTATSESDSRTSTKRSISSGNKAPEATWDENSISDSSYSRSSNGYRGGQKNGTASIWDDEYETATQISSFSTPHKAKSNASSIESSRTSNSYDNKSRQNSSAKEI